MSVQVRRSSGGVTLNVGSWKLNVEVQRSTSNVERADKTVQGCPRSDSTSRRLTLALLVADQLCQHSIQHVPIRQMRRLSNRGH